MSLKVNRVISLVPNHETIKRLLAALEGTKLEKKIKLARPETIHATCIVWETKKGDAEPIDIDQIDWKPLEQNKEFWGLHLAQFGVRLVLTIKSVGMERMRKPLEAALKGREYCPQFTPHIAVGKILIWKDIEEEIRKANEILGTRLRGLKGRFIKVSNAEIPYKMLQEKDINGTESESEEAPPKVIQIE